MGHEWKIGDRFALEGIVEHTDNGYLTVSVGPRKMTYGFHYVDFEDAKLIQPAAPEPQKLDTRGNGERNKEIIGGEIMNDSTEKGIAPTRLYYGPNGHAASYPSENVPTTEYIRADLCPKRELHGDMFVSTEPDGSRWVQHEDALKMEADIDTLKAAASRLQKDSDLLNRLYAAGVDNWEGYEDALAEGDES